MKRLLSLIATLLLLTFIIYSCSKSDPSPTQTPSQTPSTTLTSPTAGAATAVSQSGFTANWSAVMGATDYRLDISTDNFATFVTGYSNKTVTGTTEVVAGLTPATSYKYRVRAAASGNVSANSTEISVTTSAAAATDVASIGGTAFTSSSTKGTDTGSGVEITLADNSKKITIGLSDKIAGTYSVKNISSGRTSVTTEAMITVLMDGVLFFGTSGNVVVTVGTDGKLSATFDASLKNSAGTPLSISGGKFAGLAVAAPPTVCKLTSISYSNSAATCDNAGISLTFFYNGDGKLSKAVGSTVTLSYSYDLSGRLAAIAGATTTGTYNTEFTYTGTTLTSYKTKEVNTQSGQTTTSTDNFTISYSGTTITNIAHTNTTTTGASTTKATNNYTFTVSNGNVTSYAVASSRTSASNVESNYSNTYKYGNYDTKKNPYSLLAQLTGAPIAFFYGGTDYLFKFFSLDTNNPAYVEQTTGTSSTADYIDTYTYTYNAQNYPTQILRTRSGYSCTDTFVLTYTNCP